ncbi:serine/threonine-protein kinase [Gordonia sp. (in: high G+C Gram-positive bacteria)]|uniref:serine/threonine-protein kinase n=1 Tax=Gordonia sp. (in: high G+C Gram-positive bacteria) TaxID=84139 RepID=UPI002638C16D|nr:serine/threonine-protein kinase [Gordonia sp. (in: high G+C Gram-positive bacteria)]
MGETQSSRAGQTFGPYRLESLLGKGGMGEVYRAHDTVRDRTVALKLLPPHLAEDPVFQERFRRECQTLARLDEPHVIPIHDFGEIDGQLFLDMRLVNGNDLRAIMRERGVLEPAEAVALIEQVAAALDAAHDAGLVHRDVKPENVLVTHADFAYLVDFGVAHAETDTHLTRTGTAIGSVAYMAPEQFDDKPVTGAADTYAMTVMLFELLTGHKPFPGESVSTITKGVLFDEVPVASSINPAITPALDAVLAWGLNKSPEQRCPSSLELARAARAALAGERPPTLGESETGLIGGPGAGRTTGFPVAPTAVMGSVSNPAISNPAISNPAISNPAIDRTGVAGAGYHPGALYGPPGGQPPGYPPQAYPPPPPSGRSTTNTVLLVSIGVVIAALIGIGAWLIADRMGGSDGNDTAAAGGVTTVTTTTDDGATTSDASGGTTATWTPGSPPSDNQPCPGYTGVGTGYPQWTGCEFAANVRDAYVRSGPMGEARTVNGWAPQMQKNFVMECSPYLGIIACRGGNQAVVYIY